MVNLWNIELKVYSTALLQKGSVVDHQVISFSKILLLFHYCMYIIESLVTWIMWYRSSQYSLSECSVDAYTLLQ